MLVLRTCKANMTGHNNFKWPESGPVEAPDWEPTFECGHGLHGLPWGLGRSGYLDWSDDAKWLVVEVADGDVLTGQGKLIDKCKFPKGNVVFCGDRGGAVEYMMAHGADGSKMVGGISTSGYNGQSTSGNMGSISIRWWNAKSNRWRIAIGYVGEDGIEANVPYRCDENGKLVKAQGEGE
jgi:hypothetical protein